MRAVLVITSVIMLFSLIRCSSKIQQAKEMELRVSLEEDEKSNDFDLMEILTDCNETFRIEMFYIEALNSSGSFPDETDRTPKCFIRCVLEKSGVTVEGEEFDVERSAEVFSRVRKTTPIDGIRDIATDCSKRAESCKCERSYQFLKCLIEAEIETYET